MRNTKELLIIVQEHAEWYLINYRDGLCSVAGALCAEGLINPVEKSRLKSYIKMHMPEYYNKVTGKLSAYGWTPGAIPPRLQFLDKHIKSH